MDEVELKLRVDPADLPRLRTLPLFGAAGRGVTRRLESVYFDTPDLRLYRREVTLRVRRQGRRYVQTVKGPGRGDGLLQMRGEWEAPVASCVPDLDALPDPAAREQLGPLVPADLQPVFESSIRRTVRVVRDPDGGDARVEVAIDHGRIRTAAGEAQEVCEVELELKSGDPQALYRLALMLAEQVPLRVERRTKAERGYALAAGPAAGPPPPRKAARIDYAPDATVEEVLEAIGRECLAHVAANEEAVLDGRGSEGVHQMRVALRRLRSALAVFGRIVPEGQRTALDRELRWLTDALGAGRDWDVFAEDLLAPVAEALAGDAAVEGPVEALRALVDEARRRGREAAAEAVRSPRYAALLLTLSGWIQTRGWRSQPVSEEAADLFRPAAELAGRLLDQRHRQARRRGAGFERLEAEPRHRVRIALKKLRYAAEFFRPLHEGGRRGKAYARYHRRLAALQESLGHLNDVATAQRLIGGLEALAAETGAPPSWRIAGGLVVGWHARGVAEGEERIVADWTAFRDAEPYWTDRA